MSFFATLNNKQTNFFCKKEKALYLCRKDYLKLSNKMKKFYLLLMLSLASLSIKAQFYTDDLDWGTLQGRWNVTSYSGVFNDFYSEPSYIAFRGMEKYERTSIGGTLGDYKGYWISSGNTGRYYLHFMPRSNGDANILTFLIESFHNGVLTLVTRDGLGRMDLQKEDTSSVSSTKKNAKTNGKAYDINGIEISDPNSTKGIVIQDGQKVLR